MAKKNVKTQQKSTEIPLLQPGTFLVFGIISAIFASFVQSTQVSFFLFLEAGILIIYSLILLFIKPKQSQKDKKRSRFIILSLFFFLLFLAGLMFSLATLWFDYQYGWHPQSILFRQFNLPCCGLINK